MSAITNSFSVLKQTYNDFSQDRCMTMAAALAYYTVFSLPPLLVIVVTIAGMVWGADAVSGRLEQEIAGVVGDGGKEQIQTMIDNAGNTGKGPWATAIGIAVLVFGATAVFAQLQAALNRAWEIEPDPNAGGIKNFILKRVLSLGMVLGIAFLLLVSMVLTTIVSAAGERVGSLLPDSMSAGLMHAVNFGVSLVIVVVLFAAMFKFLPDAKIAWRDVWLGATITGILFMLGKFVLGFYLGQKEPGAYGAAGSMVLIISWIYYAAVIFLFGAELTQVWATRYGNAIKPKEGAMRIVEKRERVPSA